MPQAGKGKIAAMTIAKSVFLQYAPIVMGKMKHIKPQPPDFLDIVEFREAALLSFATSAIIVPAYDRVKKEFGIIRAEYLLLLCLAHFPVLTAQDISRITGRPRNSISRAVHRMLNEGYITRVPDPDDGRQSNLAITETGKALHKKIAARLVESQDKVLASLSQQERATLENILDKLARNTSAHL